MVNVSKIDHEGFFGVTRWEKEAQLQDGLKHGDTAAAQHQV